MKEHPLPTWQPFLSGDGEMATLTREYDWRGSPLGTPDKWPQSLLTTLGIVLHSAFPMFLFWGDELICFYNDAFRPSLGSDGKHPAVGRRGREVWGDIWEQISPWIRQVRDTGKPVFFEDQLVPFYRNGKTEDIYWTFSYSPAYGDTGINGVFVTCFETTARIVDHREAKKSEQKVRSLVESAPFPIGVYTGREMRIELLNKAILDLWGKGDDIVGKLYAEVLPEVEEQNVFSQLDDVFTKGIPFHARDQRIELVVNGKPQTFYFNYSFTPLYDADGKIYGVMNTAADVTDLHLSKQRIEQNEKNFRNMVLLAPTAMCILMGPSHIIEVANEPMIELWGKSRADVMGKPVFEALPDAREQGLEEVMHHVYISGETFSASERPVQLLRNGKWETVYQNFVYQPYRDSDGSILGVIAISVDVTAQVQARHRIEDIVNQRTAELNTANERLRRSNEELAQFAYIASHDLQEPARKVGIFAEMLGSMFPENKQAGHYINRLQTASSRMLNLIRDILSYSQVAPDRMVPEQVDLNMVIGNVAEDLELLISQRKAVLHFHDLPIVAGIPLQMSQLFGNLITNALKFVRKEATPVITITARMAEDNDPALPADLRVAGSRYHYIQVADNGIGFKPDQSEKIFHIFQRLHGKQEYEGTGIGLATCRKIVRNHGGHIYASAVPGEGATFHILLPLSGVKGVVPEDIGADHGMH